MRHDPLEVRLSGVEIGELLPGARFRWVDGWERIAPLNSPVLSHSLPFGDAAADPGPFFGGLLPEGLGLERLAREANLAVTDLFGLLAEVGVDVGGSVTVGEPRPPLEPVEIDESEIDRVLERALGYIRGAAVGGGGSAATGVQAKVALTWDSVRHQWLIGRGSTPSTHLLKPVRGEYAERIHAEAHLNTVARHLGLSTHGAWVATGAQRSVLIVERYDRRVDPSGVIARVHQEDAAQALGLPWGGNDKYERVNPRANLAAIAALLPPDSPFTKVAGSDRERLLALTVLNIAAGNTDAHAKNFSLMLPGLPAAFDLAGRTSVLADAYDLVPQVLFDHEVGALALRVADKYLWAEITAADLVSEGMRWGLPEATAARVVEETLARIQEAAEQLGKPQLHVGQEWAGVADGRGSGDNAEAAVRSGMRVRALLGEVTANLQRGDAAWTRRGLPPAIAIR